jgi:hypothetical protein
MNSNLGGEPIFSGPCAKEQYGCYRRLLNALPLSLTSNTSVSMGLGFPSVRQKTVYIR